MSIRERAESPGERGQSGEDEMESRGVRGQKGGERNIRKWRCLFKVVKKGTHRLHKKASSGLWDYATSINSKAQWASWKHLVPSVWFLAVEFKATQEHIGEMLWDLEMTSQTSNLGPCSLDPQTLIWWKRVSLILHYDLILDLPWHFLEWLP